MKIVLFIILISPLYVKSYNQLQVAKVKKAVSTQQQVVATGGDFRGLGDLFKGMNFSNTHFSGATFAKNDQGVVSAAGTVKVPDQASDLSGCNFSNATLISTSFVGANLENANFSQADIAWADFSETNLKGATGFDTAKNIDKAKFCKAILPTGITLSSNQVSGGSFKAYCKK